MEGVSTVIVESDKRLKKSLSIRNGFMTYDEVTDMIELLASNANSKHHSQSLMLQFGVNGALPCETRTKVKAKARSWSW
jgi:hemerythrin-like domain-containing protein